MSTIRTGTPFLILALILAACALSPAEAPTPADAAPPANPAHAQLPDPQLTARAYLDAWKESDYTAMYLWLTPISQEAASLEDFATLHDELAATLTLSQVNYELLSTFAEGRSAQVAYRVQLQTILVGEIVRDTTMTLSLEGGQWRIQWDRSLILPELRGGNTLSMEYRTPSRGDIYDRNGHALVAAETNAVSIGLVAGETDPAQEEDLFHQLWALTGVTPDEIRADLAAARPGWYVPLAEVPASLIQPQLATLETFAGLVLEPFTSRYYFGGGIAPQTLGYVSLIQPEEADTYRRLGYRADERIGRLGLEKWAEPFLSGTRGGALYVISPEGARVTLLAESSPQPAQALHTTLDRDLQLHTQEMMERFTGAAVVLELHTGRILALVSSPGYDPNLFEPANYNSDYLLGDLLTDPRTPLLNRATQGQYPLGSVFKIITLAAALESGRYTANSTLYCGHYFTEIPGITREDWTVAYNVPPSGYLSLPEGLMRSCNPWFWHIGLDLWNTGLDTAIADMAGGFGLGQPSGIQQIVEETGNIPVPVNAVDAINLAIGQGATQVTPLQVARFIAAIGNGGEVLRPQIIEQVVTADGDQVYAFKPEILGSLPVSDATLATLQTALEWVVGDFRGTAYYAFRGLDVPVAGKTGTAEAPPGNPHAWFAGYTFANNPDLPDIAVVVIAENAGEGSQVGAPLFRRVVELYFGLELTALPWENAAPVIPPVDEP
jgi:penicillin-binding protein 2